MLDDDTNSVEAGAGMMAVTTTGNKLGMDSGKSVSEGEKGFNRVAVTGGAGEEEKVKGSKSRES